MTILHKMKSTSFNGWLCRIYHPISTLAAMRDARFSDIGLPLHAYSFWNPRLEVTRDMKITGTNLSFHTSSLWSPKNIFVARIIIFYKTYFENISVKRSLHFDFSARSRNVVIISQKSSPSGWKSSLWTNRRPRTTSFAPIIFDVCKDGVFGAWVVITWCGFLCLHLVSGFLRRSHHCSLSIHDSHSSCLNSPS